jgi:hypothetical protein
MNTETEQSKTDTSPPDIDDDDDGDDDNPSVRVSICVYDGDAVRDTGVQLFSASTDQIGMDHVANAIIESCVGLAAMVGPELSLALHDRLVAYGNVPR